MIAIANRAREKESEKDKVIEERGGEYGDADGVRGSASKGKFSTWHIIDLRREEKDQNERIEGWREEGREVGGRWTSSFEVPVGASNSRLAISDKAPGQSAANKEKEKKKRRKKEEGEHIFLRKKRREGKGGRGQGEKDRMITSAQR